jgi:hypothetical protein
MSRWSRREMTRRSSVSVTFSVYDRPSGPLISSFVTFVRRRTFPAGSVSNSTEIVPELESLITAAEKVCSLPSRKTPSS